MLQAAHDAVLEFQTENSAHIAQELGDLDTVLALLGGLRAASEHEIAATGGKWAAELARLGARRAKQVDAFGSEVRSGLVDFRDVHACSVKKYILHSR